MNGASASAPSVCHAGEDVSPHGRGRGDQAEDDQQRAKPARRPPAPPDHSDEDGRRDEVGLVQARHLGPAQMRAPTREHECHRYERNGGDQRERLQPPRARCGDVRDRPPAGRGSLSGQSGCGFAHGITRTSSHAGSLRVPPGSTGFGSVGPWNPSTRSGEARSDPRRDRRRLVPDARGARRSARAPPPWTWSRPVRMDGVAGRRRDAVPRRRRHGPAHATVRRRRGSAGRDEASDASPEVGVIVLSQFAEPRDVLALLAGGASGRGYLLKDRVRDGRRSRNGHQGGRPRWFRRGSRRRVAAARHPGRAAIDTRRRSLRASAMSWSRWRTARATRRSERRSP